MELYLAVCCTTNVAKIFTSLYEIEEFAKEKAYSHDYYKLVNAEPLSDCELGYSN